MFVITADQVSSRTSPDAVDDAVRTIGTVGRGRVILEPERTVGDEVQVATDDAACVLDIVRALTRTDRWSVGCGAGEIEPIVSPSIRAARGSAFVAAREAVDAAKKRTTRFALRRVDGPRELTDDAQALIDLLLTIRARRTAEGWEVFDLVGSGASQAAIAHELGITVQAVSGRVHRARVSVEMDALPALTRALEQVNATRGE